MPLVQLLMNMRRWIIVCRNTRQMTQHNFRSISDSVPRSIAYGTIWTRFELAQINRSSVMHSKAEGNTEKGRVTKVKRASGNIQHVRRHQFVAFPAFWLKTSWQGSSSGWASDLYYKQNTTTTERNRQKMQTIKTLVSDSRSLGGGRREQKLCSPWNGKYALNLWQVYCYERVSLWIH